jgi:catechol 2,3-dioxygenase-like lactoylglutathione lyase family enzyme
MTETKTPPPTIMNHVSLGTADFDKAASFYDRVLTTIGARRLMEHPGAVAYGKMYPEFWLQTPIDGAPAGIANGSHVAFMATSKEQVQAFWTEALAAGAEGDGEPGPRAHYGDAYYGCFVRDLDGHKIEATFWDMSLASAGPG